MWVQGLHATEWLVDWRRAHGRSDMGALSQPHFKGHSTSSISHCSHIDSDYLQVQGSGAHFLAGRTC